MDSTNDKPFDPNGPGLPDTLFGLPFSPESARVIVVPVPWDATVSYHTGTAGAPAAILKASRQLDFFMREIPEAWKMGIAMTKIPDEIKKSGDQLRILVEQLRGKTQREEASELLVAKVNEGCESLNIYVRNTVQHYLDRGKIVGIVGGDHSTPLGFLRWLSQKHERFGILQIDAHADLRKAYEGFTYSHGSIMFNVMKMPSVAKLIQVGVRDLCEEELGMMSRGMGRVKTFFDDDIRSDLGGGKTWDKLCTEIVRELPEKVYISFDIDGLDPSLCPNTGTPVPGGLNFHQAAGLIKAVATSGRTIIGFDLVEVGNSPGNDWDANVGARILWQLCNWTGVSNKFLTAGIR